MVSCLVCAPDFRWWVKGRFGRLFKRILIGTPRRVSSQPSLNLLLSAAPGRGAYSDVGSAQGGSVSGIPRSLYFDLRTNRWDVEIADRPPLPCARLAVTLSKNKI